MKKFASLIIGVFLMFTPALTHADAISDAQMISLLQQIIVVLTQQLNLLLAQRGLLNPITQTDSSSGTTTPSIVFNTATSTFSIPVDNAPAHEAPIPADTTKPKLWEAQFGGDIDAQYAGQNVIRIVTSEPVDLSKVKFHFRDLPDNLEWVEKPVSISVIVENGVRDQQTNCWVNCDRVGYESVFTVTSPLSVDVPQRYSSDGPNNVFYGPEFIIPDMSGNYFSPWQSARDITRFIYE